MAGSEFEKELGQGEYEIAASGTQSSMSNFVTAFMCGQCLQIILKPGKLKKKVRSGKTVPGPGR